MASSQTHVQTGPQARPEPGSLVGAEQLALSPELFEGFVYGLVMAEGDGRVLYLNRAARRLLLPASAAGGRTEFRCCDLICSRLGPIVGGGCMTEWVRTMPGQLPEVRMDIEHERLHTAAWVTASRVEPDGSRVLFHLRPGKPGDRRRRTPPAWKGAPGALGRAELLISTLGRLQVEGSEGPMNGDWLDQRPGQLLKFLLCQRRRTVSSDQISEALWPEAGRDEGRSRVRYNVHALRERLEPRRGRREEARFVVGLKGGYVFDTADVWLDADMFEIEAKAGLAALDRGIAAEASAHLADAMGLYQGEFLASDAYLEWAVPERERLHELATRVLRAQVRISLGEGELEAAAEQSRRLAEMEPFDSDTQRLAIEICLRRGRRSEAVRRYTLFRKRMTESFGIGPDFDLAEVSASASARSA